MGSNNIELSFLSIFALITFFIFLIVSKYSYKIKNAILLDQDFSKPQSFHQTAVSRGGGIAGIISLNIFFWYLLLTIFKNFIRIYFYKFFNVFYRIFR